MMTAQPISNAPLLSDLLEVSSAGVGLPNTAIDGIAIDSRQVVSGFLFFALANIISLLKNGGGNFAGYFIVLLFVSLTVVIIFFTLQALPNLNWKAPVPILQQQLF